MLQNDELPILRDNCFPHPGLFWSERTMNKYEKRAMAERKAAVRSSMTIWSAGIALIVVVVLIGGLSASAPSNFYKKAAIVVAILLLILRQLARRARTGAPRAAQPDPKSSIKLS
jgi:uncharacterized membrane protein